MKKIMFVLLILVIALVAINLWIWKQKNGRTSISQRKHEICRKKSIVWKKAEYFITSRENTKYVLKIEKRNKSSWTTGLNPLSASEIAKGYTVCNFQVFITPSEKGISPNLLKEFPKGVVVSIGSKQAGHYQPFAKMTLAIMIFAPIDSTKNYNVDALFEHIANSYYLVTETNSTLSLALQDPLLAFGVEGTEYDYFFARLNGKEMNGKVVEFVSKDKGKTWTPKMFNDR